MYLLNKKIAFVVGMLTCTFASAQTVNFEGVSAGFGVNVAESKVSYSDSTPRALDLGKKIDYAPYVDLSYHKALNDKFLLGVGATYNLSETDAGSAFFRQANGQMSAEFKDNYSIYLQPSYVLSKTTAVFAKLGYHEMKGNITLTNCGGCQDSVKFRGLGYGLGVKTFVNKNVYLQAEGQILDINDKTLRDDQGSWNYSVKSQSLMFSAGYKF